MAGALMIPAVAQTADPNAPANPPSPTTMPSTTDRVGDRDHDFNMGWLGLAGLAGLLGLRRHTHRHDEPRNIDNTGPSAVR
jgi:MYXO-CTERM domain-containing protein